VPGIGWISGDTTFEDADEVAGESAGVVIGDGKHGP
jgi:hypothetical protein